MSLSFASLEAILDRVPRTPEHLIPALQGIQAEFGHVSSEALRAACEHVGVPESRGWSVATFYRFFNLDPKPEHEVSVCMGTACHVRGAPRVYDKFKRELERAEPGGGGEKGAASSPKKVYCLGCCSMGPIAQVDDEILSNLDQEKVGAFIESRIKKVRP